MRRLWLAGLFLLFGCQASPPIVQAPKPVKSAVRPPPKIAANTIARGLPVPVVVLTFHDIVPDHMPGRLWFDCTASEFRKIIAEMQASKVHFISVSQLMAYLVAGIALPARPVCLTFADNYRGFFEHAWPVLRQENIPAAMYVHTGFVGSSVGRPKMDWATLKALDISGLTLGSQTVSHPLDLRTVTDTQLGKEMRDSKLAMEQHLGHSVATLAYPNGKYNRRVELAARAAGYSMAFTEVTKPANLSPSLFAVNRYVHTKWREALSHLRSER